MARTSRNAWAAALLAVCLCGCTITQMQRDNDATRGRIDVKTTTLAKEEEQQAQLKGQRDQLLSDLRSRQLTAEQLNARLDALIKANDEAAIGNAEAQKRHDLIAKRLLEIKKQAQPLPPTPGVSPQDRAKEEAAARERNYKALEFLLNS